MTSTAHSGLNEVTRLRLDEAVLLCHAMINHLATGLALRVFFIKGPAASDQGLRSARISADADVLVEPGKVEMLARSLIELGWVLRIPDPDAVAFPQHSLTLYHADWPCDVDLHYRYPGMETDARTSFEYMWKSTIPWRAAGHEIRIPNAALAICLLALHDLRSPWSAKSQRELESLHSRTPESLKDSLVAIAMQTGSLAALRPFLTRRFGEDLVSEWGQPSREWRIRTSVQTPASARALSLMQAKWWQRPKMLIEAVYPSKTVLMNQNIYAGASFAGRLRGRLARVGRLVAGFSQVLHDVRRYSERLSPADSSTRQRSSSKREESRDDATSEA